MADLVPTSSNIEPTLSSGIAIGNAGTTPAGAAIATQEKPSSPPLQIVIGPQKPPPLHTYILRGMGPDELAHLLEQFDRGYLRSVIPVWRKMARRDDHLLSVTEKRLGRLAAKDWEVTPVDSSKEAMAQAEAVGEFLESIEKFETRLAELGEALKYSIAGHEIEWLPGGGPGGKLGAKLWPLNPEDFDLTLDRARILVGVNYVELPADKFVVHRLPVARMEASSILYILKSMTLGFWNAFSEKFGMPSVIGECPAGASDADVQKFYEMLVNWSQELVAAIKEGYKINPIQAAGAVTTGHSTYSQLVDWADKAMSKIWTGHTVTTQAESGTGTLSGGAAQDQLDELTAGDAERLAGTIDECLVEPFARFTFGVAPLCHFNFKSATVEDLGKVAEILTKLAALGMTFPAADAYTRFGWRMPEADEAVIGGRTTSITSPVPGEGLTNAADLTSAFKTAVAAQVQALTQPHMEAAREAMTHMLEPLQKLIDGAGDLSPDELRKKILDLNLPLEGFTTVMGQILASAQKAGATKVLQQAGESLRSGGTK